MRHAGYGGHCREEHAPAWARPGVYVYRISTPDEAKVLDNVEAGLKITARLLDGSVRQIPIINGIIGHDHPGMCNWDGLWPYWNRVTYRGGDWNRLAAFMRRTRDMSNTYPGFHVNLTDVNVGLRDYPESRAFFEELVETQSIYRREWNPATNCAIVDRRACRERFRAKMGRSRSLPWSTNHHPGALPHRQRQPARHS